MKNKHQDYVYKVLSFFNYILQWKLIYQYTCLFAFFCANKAKSPIFKKGHR